MSFTAAIVGRPNVGKSTLFNRLVGQRLALVDDTPGVTRDRREGEARLADLGFRVIDTAGLQETAVGVRGQPSSGSATGAAPLRQGAPPAGRSPAAAGAATTASQTARPPGCGGGQARGAGGRTSGSAIRCAP